MECFKYIDLVDRSDLYTNFTSVSCDSLGNFVETEGSICQSHPKPITWLFFIGSVRTLKNSMI